MSVHPTVVAPFRDDWKNDPLDELANWTAARENASLGSPSVAICELLPTSVVCAEQVLGWLTQVNRATCRSWMGPNTCPMALRDPAEVAAQAARTGSPVVDILAQQISDSEAALAYAQNASKMPTDTPVLIFPAEAAYPGLSLMMANSEEAALVNLASAQRTAHILDGHTLPGEPGNTLFPPDWSPAKIMHAISDIATDPTLSAVQQTGTPGSLLMRNGFPARFTIEAIRDGIRIRVVYEPGTPQVPGEGIISGYPVR